MCYWICKLSYSIKMYSFADWNKFCILIEERNFSLLLIIGKKLDSGYFVLSHSCHAVLDYILTTDEVRVYHNTPEIKEQAWGGNIFGPRYRRIYKLWNCWHKYGHSKFGPQRCVISRLRVLGNNSKCRFIIRDTVTLTSNHQNKTPWAIFERRTASARQQSATKC